MNRGPSQDDELLRLIIRKRKIYDRIGVIDCRILRKKVRFNIAGFRHLHVDGQGKYRTKQIAISRLELMEYAKGVVENGQMIRTSTLAASDTSSGKIEVYHNLYAKVGQRQIKVMVTIRVIGGGDPHFYGIRRD